MSPKSKCILQHAAVFQNTWEIVCVLNFSSLPVTYLILLSEEAGEEKNICVRMWKTPSPPSAEPSGGPQIAEFSERTLSEIVDRQWKRVENFGSNIRTSRSGGSLSKKRETAKQTDGRLASRKMSKCVSWQIGYVCNCQMGSSEIW